ncbi:MAG: hypothetical protein ACREXW_09800 [Gammaproteobacteria bacterium]
MVTNAAEQHAQDISIRLRASQLEATFRINIFSMFYLTKAALACASPRRRPNHQRHLRHGIALAPFPDGPSGLTRLKPD